MGRLDCGIIGCDTSNIDVVVFFWWFCFPQFFLWDIFCSPDSIFYEFFLINFASRMAFKSSNFCFECSLSLTIVLIRLSMLNGMLTFVCLGCRESKVM